MILLVEDEAIIAIGEKRTLEKYGYDVVLASSGEEALALMATATGVSLVLMDIDLGPGMDGTVTAQKILEGYDVPLIFLSSHVERKIVDKTEGITSYGYIVKNTGETVLVASVRMAYRLFEARQREKDKERALANSEARFRRLFDQVPTVAMQGYDADAKVTYWNEASHALYGYAPEEALGRSLLDLIIPEEMRSMVQADVRRMVSTGVPSPAAELSLQRKDGTRVSVYSSHAVVKREDGGNELFCLDIERCPDPDRIGRGSN